MRSTSFKFKLLFTVLLFIIGFQAEAQIQDTILVDYTTNSCNICSDANYSCKGNDSLQFIDSTASNLRLNQIKIIFLHTPCTGSTTYLTLNGDSIGTISNSYDCRCNSCTADSVVISGAKLNSYELGDTNVFKYEMNSGSMCIARYMIIRTWVYAVDYNMATQQLISPLFDCAGSQSVQVQIANLGIKQVDSVEVHWTYNGASQSTVKATGTIDTMGGSGSYLKTVTLGSKTLSAGKIDTLVAWTEKPNGQNDTINDDDTLVAYVTPAFKDTLTIGGSSPDFTKIQDAFDALMTFGVCGPVWLNIRSGTYNEQLMLGPIPGSDTTNTITVQSSSKDSSSVTIYYSASSSMNFVLRLYQVMNVRFQHLTIEATNSSYARVVDLVSCENLAINNCKLIGSSSSSTSNARAIIYNYSTDNCYNLNVQNCLFDKGAYGIYLNTSSGGTCAGISIVQNVFLTQYYMNIFLYGCEEITVQRNDCSRSSSANSSGVNIFLDRHVAPATIADNILTSAIGGTGLEIRDNTGDTNRITQVFNNFISITSPYSYLCRPFSCYYGDFVNIYHNNMLAESTSSSSDAVYFDRGNDLRFVNNCVVNKTPGKAIYNLYSSSQNITYSNHNNLYTTGSNLGFWNGSVSSLASWQSASGQDSLSYSVDALYKSSTDLHTVSIELNGNAETGFGIDQDIDGEARDTSRPDIGADEFKLPPVDASLIELKKFKADTSCITVVLRNLGDDTLKSVSIVWLFDGVSQTPYSWTGSLLSGDTSIVCIGTKVFKKDSSYNFKIWTSTPNGTTDTVNQNDTITKIVYPALSGVYTIGGSSPDYASFTEAVTALQNSGVIDSAKFKVRDGTYTEQIRIQEIECVGSRDQVIFESESKDSTKVILTYGSSNSSTNYVIWLDGADGVTFRHMTLENKTVNYYKIVVKLSNGANNNVLSNNYIFNNDTSSTTSSQALVNNEGTTDDNFCLIDNLLERGSIGYFGEGAFSAHDNGLHIRNNRFKNQAYAGVYTNYIDDLNIVQNNITSNSSNYWLCLYIYEGGRSVIERNRMIGPGLNETYGMYVSNLDNGDSSWIVNNFVSMGGSGTSRYGIRIQNVSACQVYNNSVFTSQTDTTNSGALRVASGTYHIANNNLICSNGGYGFYRGNGSITSDFNNINTGSDRITYWSGIHYDLASHIAASGNDSNSISLDPKFVSQSDLHITNPAMDMTGTPLSDVKFDIDGDTRDSIPDIGADEFTPAKSDIGVKAFVSPEDPFPADTVAIKVVVFNYGTDTVFSGNVHAQINGDTLTRIAFNDTLPSGDTLQITIGSYTFASDTSYNIFAWTSKPNGVTDQKADNDSTKLLGKLAALSGTYTIGGSSPDFSSFTSSVAAMKARGIYGNVVFKVRNGTYTEQLVIPTILGASDKNDIIFEGENSDSTLVVLQFSSTKYDTNYTVYLDGAAGITFRHLTLKAGGSSYGGVLLFENGSHNLCIENSIVRGYNITYTTSYHYLVQSLSSQDTGFTCRFNRFYDGSNSLYLYGPSSYGQRETGYTINNNRFEGFTGMAILTYYHKGIHVIGNSILTDRSIDRAIYLNYPTDNFIVSKNNITLPFQGTGIYIYSGGYNSSDSCFLTNNSVSIAKTYSTSKGVYLYRPYGMRIAHNTIFISGTGSTSSYCLGIQGSSSGINVLNNILRHSGGGYTFYFSNLSSIDSCDFNNAYSSGSNFGYYNSSNATDLTSWQNATTLDSNSNMWNPMFVSNTDLHLTNVDFDETVRRLPYVPQDIENETRDSITDFGAYRIELKALDAGVSSIISPKTPFLSDTQSVTVVLKNFGTTTLSNVKIHWVLNGDTGTIYNWADTLLSKDTVHLALSTEFFHPDSSYSLKSWTSEPNGGTDLETINDTAETLNQFPSLSGIYTIGGASPDFVNFNEAVDALKKAGIIDSVVFNVRNGTYTEQITIPRIIGASKKNSIVFQSIGATNTDNVILSDSTSNSSLNWVVKLDSVHGVTFRKMTLTNKGYYYGRIVVMTNDADYNLFDSCAFVGNKLYSTSSTSKALVYSVTVNNHTNDFNCFRGNSFLYGSYGISESGYNGSSSISDEFWEVTGNTFTDHYYIALDMRYGENLLVQRNMVTQSGTFATSSNYGLNIFYQRGEFKFTHNSVKGKYYTACYLYDCDGTSSARGLVANNLLHTNQAAAFGLYHSSSSYVNFYNNNIYTSASTGNCRALYTTSVSNNMLVNNIISNNSTSGYAWYHNGYGSNFNRLDYNCYYTNSSILAYMGYGNRANLANLKTSTGKDTSSISVDPSFVTDEDLHVREINLNEAGTPLSEITNDYDLEPRDTTKPDIGADEFEPPAPEDAGVIAYYKPEKPFKSGTKTVEVVLKNFGSDTLTSATIQWTANGTSQTALSWTGSLLPGDLDTTALGSFTFNKVTQYDFVFWSTNPNGVADTINYNDTASKYEVYAALDTTYTIGSSGADFPSFTKAADVLEKAGVLDTVIFKVQTGTYNEQFKIGSYAGASPSNPVTFEANSGDSSDVILTYNNPYNLNYLIYLDGATNIHFKHLTFKPTSYYYGHVIVYDGGSHGLWVQNCQFTGISNPYSYNSSIFISSSTDNDDSCRFEYNYFLNGNTAIQVYGLGSYSAETGTVIQNNRFEGGQIGAINISSQTGLVVSSNNITLKDNFITKYGIYVSNSQNNLRIIGNTIYGYGIYDYGIYISHAGTSSKRGLVANNIVSLAKSAGGRSGIHSSNSSYLDIYFNSVHLYNNSVQSCYAVRIYIGSNIRLNNNIISNQGIGYAIYRTGASVTVCDYNNFYATGSYLGYYSGNRTSLSAWQTATSLDANSKNSDPLFTADDNLHVYVSVLDSAATPISGITTDIDGDVRNTTHPDIGADEFNSLLNNIGVSAILKPTTGCELDTQVIRVTVFNFGSQSQNNFPIWYQVDGGSLIKDTVSSAVGPGGSFNFDFTQKVIFTSFKDYTIKAWTSLPTDQNNSNDSSLLIITNHATPGMVSNMYPLDTTKNLDYPITLSWAPSSGTQKYDVYIWDDTASVRPSSPFKSDLTQISTQIWSGLTFGRTYKWQVVSKNIACGTDGPIQRFTMKYLPDLIVQSVSSPVTAFTGKTVSISWTIKNNGGGSTGSKQWYDYVYLSSDTIFDGSDSYMGGVRNLTSLNPGQTYSNSKDIYLPNGVTGNFYAIVYTDNGTRILETDEGNNISHDTSRMVIKLTPPPDLKVVGSTHPSKAFSGTIINVTFTVKNDGTGPPIATKWQDRIYFSADTVYNSSAVKLKTINRNGILDPDSTYKVSAAVMVPNFIFGRHYLYLVTDYLNQVYEHTNEGNNIGRSDTIGVILSPPPDLVVRDLVLPDTASAASYITADFNTINQGGGHTTNGFYDAIYYSTSNIFSTATATQLKANYHNAIAAGDTAQQSLAFALPSNLVGKYYFFALTDISNRVNEYIYESNNVSAVDSIVLLAPDLRIASVLAASKDTTGDTTVLTYDIFNDGNGNVTNKNRTDRFYMSKSLSGHPDSLLVLKNENYNLFIASKDTVTRSSVVQIPDGFDGDYYFFVDTDILNNVFENGLDTNNRGRSSKMEIILAPYPDLVPEFVATPDSAVAGDTATFAFKVTNEGDTTANPLWRDYLFISSDSVLSSDDQVIFQFTRTSKLNKNEAYSVQNLVTLPNTLAQGNYYFFIATDVDNNLYEYNKENNNTARSALTFIDGYPPIDLKVLSVVAPDTMYSGENVEFQWTVKNIGQASTISSYWQDIVYVSSDSILDVSTDVKLLTQQINTPLDSDSSYTSTVNFKIPDGLFGEYYIFVYADKFNSNKDFNVNNNKDGKRSGGVMVKSTFLLTPPPDLTIAFKSAPSTGVSGQQIGISWEVTNDGTGPTTNGYWTDNVYLSTDYVLGGGDYRISNRIHKTNLKVDSSYIDTVNAFIPSSYVGNYILIISTDHENREYEYNKENNNTAAGIISISQSPPADLVVSEVNAKDSVTSGETIKVVWEITNEGSNAASGYMTDNVYLSKDKLIDASDKLIGTKTYSLSLAPSTSRKDSISANASGVALGDYFVIVGTDIRNNINESNDTNNVGSSEALNINIPELFLGTVKRDNLPDNVGKFYRLYIHDSLIGESILLTLDGDSANGNNELFMRHLDVPSRSEFDYGYTNPFAGDQEIVVPVIDSGTYYILVYGDNTAGSSQTIDLLAEKMEFEIRKVTPKAGGNTGQVTLRIEGSKFTPLTQFMLSNGSGWIGGIVPDSLEDEARKDRVVGNQGPDTFLVVNPTLAYVTFNLAGQELGDYDMFGLNENENLSVDTARLADAFAIETGLPPDIQLNVIRPSNARTNRVISFDVNFTNNGNNDIVNGKLLLLSNAGNPIAFTPEGLDDKKTQLDIPLEEEEGLKGRLRPGGSGSTKVYTKATNALGFSIILPE
jgi:CARDB